MDVGVVPDAGEPARFEVLGVVRAFRAGDELELGPAKQRAVLAVLLLSPGQAVAPHRIVDAVWGDEPPENGANVVQKYVAGLRRVLEPHRSPRTPGELLTLTDGGYRLNVRPEALDVERFRSGVARSGTVRAAGQRAAAAAALREALGWWRGPAFTGQTGAVFESARLRLADEQATAWESWSELELELGRHAALVPHLVRLVAEFPLREGLRALQMTALYQGGRQAEALAVYREAREFLQTEFGIEPGDQLQGVHRAILRGDVAVGAGGAAAEAVGAVDPGPDSGVAGPGPSSPGSPGWSTPPASPASSASPAAPPTAPRQFRPPAVEVAPWSPTPAGLAGMSPAPVNYSYEALTSPAPEYKPHGYPAASYPASNHRAGPSSFAPTGDQLPSAVPELPKRRRVPSWEVVFAIAVPFVTFALGNFVYFAYAGLRRHRWWLTALGIGYTVLSWTILWVGVSGDDTDTPASDLAVGLFLLSWLAAILHGVIVAISNDSPLRRDQRERARLFAYLQPERAGRLGVGRPDLTRPFADGGLVDLNNASGHELARLPGLGAGIAHRIVVERTQRAAWVQPEDLVTSGILTTRQLHRVSSRLICLPPMTTTHAPWLPPPAFDAATPGTMQTPPPDPHYPEPSDPWSDSAD